MSNKINNLEALISEKERLKILCKEKEQVIGKKLDYIQDNLGIIALETLLPINSAEKNSISGVFTGIHSLLKNFIPGFSEKFAQSEKIINMVELIVSAIITRFFKK
jgi:hypothetical protein